MEQWQETKASIDGSLQGEIDRVEAAITDLLTARDQAVAAKTAAETAATAASGYAGTASGAASTATAQATAAAASAALAGSKASDAQTAETNAALQATAAANSAAAAAVSKTNAGNSETAAAASSSAAAGNALYAEGMAKGTQNGTPVASGSPYYEDNAAYWAGEAQNHAGAAVAAAYYSEAMAKGTVDGTPVSSGDPGYEDNAEYYKDQAAAQAAAAAASAASADGTNAQKMIAAPEEASSTASAAHAAGTYFRYNSKLYKATQDIAIGDTITPNTNCVEDTVCAELTAQSEQIVDTQTWLGYPKNVFDATLFNTTNTTNWTLTKEKTSITIAHNNTFTTGSPRTDYLDLPLGNYVFHANYPDTDTPHFLLYDSNGLVKILDDNDEITVTQNNQYYLWFYTATQGTWTITGISIDANNKYGQIPQLTEKTTDVSGKDCSSLSGTEIQNIIILPTGATASAGSTNYRVNKYSVECGKTYSITGSANWGNLEWCFYDENDQPLSLGDAVENSSTFTNFANKKVSCNDKTVSYLLVPFNVTNRTWPVYCEEVYPVYGNQWRGLKWVCIGDSITASTNDSATKRYYDFVADKTGITVVNMGVSGSGYAKLSSEEKAFYQRASSCPSDADVVTIFGSFNDLGAGLEIGTVTDSETTTLAGCINATIDALQTVNPLVNLGIVAPCPWDTTQPSTSGQAYNYVEMIKAICQHRSIPFLDLWRGSNLRPWDSDFRTVAYSHDSGYGTHPDERGHKLMAPHFKAFLETLLM